MQARRSSRKGASTLLQRTDLLGAEHDALRLLRGTLPPLQHVCGLSRAGACLCHAGLLVALDFLLATHLTDDLIKQRMTVLAPSMVDGTPGAAAAAASQQARY